jgi:hypothetical protein
VRHGGPDGDHFGEGLRDVVEVARVEDDAVAFLVQLPANAVVLVLDPCLSTDPAHDRRRVLLGRGEHELQRMHQAELGAAQHAASCQEGHLAEVAGEHRCPGHVRERGAEALSNAFLDQPTAQPDAQVAG